VAPNQTRELDYETLPVEEIFALLDSDVFTLAAPLHTVFLWGIDQFLFEGEQQMALRGYRRHARLVWDKGNGVAPAFSVRFTHEYISWFYKPLFQKVAESSRGKLPTVLSERSREHSRKPDLLYSWVDTWYPDAAKIDVFSREKRQGWDQFGNEVDKFSEEGRGSGP
jgi:N6-adenosine-specific RNA methylase IME4